MTKHGIHTKINDDRFGIPSAGFQIERQSTDMGPLGPRLRPFICENGTYRITSGSFDVIERASSTGLRPLPYTPQFDVRLPEHHHVRGHDRRHGHQRDPASRSSSS